MSKNILICRLGLQKGLVVLVTDMKALQDVVVLSKTALSLEHHPFIIILKSTPPFSGEGFIILLRHFNWKRVFLISLSGPDYGELARGVRSAFQLRVNEGYTITRWVQDLTEGLTTSAIQNIYRLVKREARSKLFL